MAQKTHECSCNKLGRAYILFSLDTPSFCDKKKMHLKWGFLIAENVQDWAFAFYIRHSFCAVWGCLAHAAILSPVFSFSKTKIVLLLFGTNSC